MTIESAVISSYPSKASSSNSAACTDVVVDGSGNGNYQAIDATIDHVENVAMIHGVHVEMPRYDDDDGPIVRYLLNYWVFREICTYLAYNDNG